MKLIHSKHQFATFRPFVVDFTSVYVDPFHVPLDLYDAYCMHKHSGNISNAFPPEN